VLLASEIVRSKYQFDVAVAARDGNVYANITNIKSSKNSRIFKLPTNIRPIFIILNILRKDKKRMSD